MKDTPEQFRGAFARFADQDCDGRLEAGEYIELVHEVTNHTFIEALGDHDVLGVSDLAVLSHVRPSDLKRSFAEIHKAGVRVFPHGVEALSDIQFEELSESIQKKARAAQKKFENEGVGQQLAYSFESFRQDVGLGLRFKWAEASAGMSERYPTIWPACGKQMASPLAR